MIHKNVTQAYTLKRKQNDVTIMLIHPALTSLHYNYQSNRNFLRFLHTGMYSKEAIPNFSKGAAVGHLLSKAKRSVWTLFEQQCTVTVVKGITAIDVVNDFDAAIDSTVLAELQARNMFDKDLRIKILR